jgi:hypothetical protein
VCAAGHLARQKGRVGKEGKVEEEMKYRRRRERCKGRGGNEVQEEKNRKKRRRK